MEEVQVVLDGFRRWNETKMPKEELEMHLDELRKYLTIPEYYSPYGILAVRGTPMFDVISIWLELKNDQTIDVDTHASREIFGALQLCGGNSGNSYFYDRPKEDPDKIIPKRNSDGTLSLHLPVGDYDSPLNSFFPGFELSASFSDKAQDHVLIDTTFEMDFKNFDEFDEVLYRRVEGQHANLYVKHIVYRAAVTALVEFKLWKKADDVGSTDTSLAVNTDDVDINATVVTVSGSVYASWHHNYSSVLAHSHSEPDCHCVPMFGVPNSSVEMTLGTCMKLLRPLVTVPVYSSLVIDTNLEISGVGVVNGIVEFPAHHNIGYAVRIIEGTNGLVCQVKADWGHQYCALDQIRPPNRASESIKRHKADDDQQVSQSFRLYRHPCPRMLHGDKLMEVFSIFVGLNKDETHNIHGTIEVTDINGDFRIYDKDERNCDVLSYSKLIPIQGPHNTCFANSPLEVKVDLKAGGQEFCQGFFVWNESSAKNPWLDKYLCSVIKCDQGYVAVNYAIYSSAVQAKVLVLISVPSSDDVAGVTGRIACEYNENDSKCRYYREYLQSNMFLRGENSPVELLGSNEVAIPMSNEMRTSPSDGLSGVPLPLSKSVVCVPVDTYLAINLNLKVKTSKLEDVSFSRRVEFEIGNDSCCVIENQGYQLYVLVAWGCLMNPPQLEIPS